MYAVMAGDVRIGTVMRFAGNPAAGRWVGFSIHDERREAFRTLRAAFAWVVERHATAEGADA